MAIREKAKLGDVLIRAGAITPEQLNEALAIQKQKKKPLGKLLIELDYLTEDKLIASLSKQLNIPVVDLATLRIPDAAVKAVRENLARKHQVMPVSVQGDVLTLAMADPLNIFAIDEVTIQTGRTLLPRLAAESDIHRAIQEYYGVEASIKAAVNSLGFQESKKNKGSPAVERDRKTRVEAAEAPVARLAEMLIKQALDDGASDIHIEPTEEALNIRYRIDGVLFEASKPPKEVEAALISRIKVLANMDIAETRAPQDGGFSVRLSGREIELRVSTCPTIYGENLVLRLLDKSKLIMDLSSTGLSGENLTKFESLLGKPYGVILVTGPTGSGKTTTLYASLHRLNSPERNIKTIEDPVEYRLPGIRQTQVNPRANITFANGLRSIMRQDPDIIMVGEIRDRETAEIAIQSALTGHLVLSTLHTNDTAGALARLSDLGIEPFLLASSVVGVCAQRLVRRVCDHCKTEHEATEEERAVLFPHGDGGPLRLARGQGCRACKKSGYRGRVGLFEVMLMTDPLRDLVLKKAPPMVLKEESRVSQGLRTLREDGIAKALAGTTTVDELNRVTFAEDSEFHPRGKTMKEYAAVRI